jgi:hypothetical protein
MVSPDNGQYGKRPAPARATYYPILLTPRAYTDEGRLCSHLESQSMPNVISVSLSLKLVIVNLGEIRSSAALLLAYLQQMYCTTPIITCASQENGYHAEVVIDRQVAGIAFHPTHKSEAKTAAFEVVLNSLCPQLLDVFLSTQAKQQALKTQALSASCKEDTIRLLKKNCTLRF